MDGARWSCTESGFYDWMVADKGLSASYTEHTRRVFAAMTRAGVDWSGFNDRPEDVVRGHLAGLRRAEKVHAARACQKALNLLAEYRGLVARWALYRMPRRRLEPYTPEELVRLRESLPDNFTGKRWGAMLFLLAHTGLRKGEVYGMQVEDICSHRKAVFVRRPEKGGGRRWVVLPDSAFNPDGRLQAYLEAREERAQTGAMWVTTWGTAISEDGFAAMMQKLREWSGVDCNFNRFRHTAGTVCEELGIPSEVKVRDWDHADPRSTMHYLHGSLAARRAVMASHGAPGYDEPAGDQKTPLADAVASI